jgi:methionyl-tRNA formyltransferase
VTATITPLRLVFCGTPQFAVPTLEALIAAGHDLALVVSQPDRPVGRKQILTAPPVKLAALSHRIEVTQPEKIKSNLEFRARLEGIAPDAIVVVAYGRIVPKWMLDLPRLGCINLHGSLLPKYRGAAPIQWAIANGDEVLGNTTMLLEEGLDTGPMLMQQTMSFAPDIENTAVEALKQLASLGAPMVVEALERLASGTLTPQPQDDSQATLAPILTREDGRMDFAALTAVELSNRWRGFQPWPGAYTELAGKKLIVHQMRVVSPLDLAAEPGMLSVENHRLIVASANQTALEFLEVQPEGRNRMTAAEFLRGNAVAAGTRLG